MFTRTLASLYRYNITAARDGREQAISGYLSFVCALTSGFQTSPTLIIIDGCIFRPVCVTVESTLSARYFLPYDAFFIIYFLLSNFEMKLLFRYIYREVAQRGRGRRKERMK